MDAVRERGHDPNRRGTLGGVRLARRLHARSRHAQGTDGHARQRAVQRYLYGGLEVIGLPTDLDQRKGVVAGYRLVDSLRYTPSAPASSIKPGALEVIGSGTTRAHAVGPKHREHA